MKTRATIILGICATLALTATAGCSRLKKDDGLRFDGERMRISSKRVDKDDRTFFTVTAGPVSRSLAGAKGAAHYGGTEYCIENFGTSTIKWDVDPLSEEAATQVNRDSLILKGQCRP